MKILFVYNGLPIGGIETFIVRVSKQFKLKNYSVRILFYSNTFDIKLLSELEKYAEIYYWDDYTYGSFFSKRFYPLYKVFFPLKQNKVARDILDGITHIHAPDTYAMLFSKKLLKLNSSIKLTTGVYQINEYNINKYFKNYFGRFVNNILNIIPFQNILFFNEISRDFYKNNYNNKFSNSTLTPIGIEIEKYNGTNLAGSQNNRIVTIGRLVNWKTYNLSMIGVIKKLHSKGIYIVYESYGEGGLMNDLKNKVKEEGLENYIIFKNNIPYNEFKNKINDSLMFIGSGTSLIEASACGIPALIGIENELEPISYGFLHNTNTYSYHEKSLDYPINNIEYFILNLLNMSAEEYKSECFKAQKRADDFNMENSFKGFLDMCNNSLIWGSESKNSSNFQFVISLTLHFCLSRITKSYDKSFFNRFSIEN